MLRQYELVDRVLSYDPEANEALLNRAYVFSMHAHGSQKRASGDPYFSHPIEVAGILTDLHLDDETIATAILHDTIEDTVATPEEILAKFGPSVARLVDGVTKLSKIEAQTESERAAENLRKFLLAMSDDIRVLLVKLADRGEADHDTLPGVHCNKGCESPLTPIGIQLQRETVAAPQGTYRVVQR